MVEKRVQETVRASEGARVVVRNYFSWNLLWAARYHATEAGQIELTHQRPHAFDAAHRASVLSSILASAAFLEAMVNELFQDAHDEHVTGDDYVAPLDEGARQMMAELWRGTKEGSRLSVLEKYQLLLICSGREPLDAGAQPYQDASLVVQLRNAIAHYQPEDLSADESHKMQARLKGRFPDNELMAGSANPWWPDHCLGHGCSVWAVEAVEALSDRVSAEVSIRPNYMRVRDDNWHGLGSPEAR